MLIRGCFLQFQQIEHYQTWTEPPQPQNYNPLPENPQIGTSPYETISPAPYEPNMNQNYLNNARNAKQIGKFYLSFSAFVSAHGPISFPVLIINYEKTEPIFNKIFFGLPST